MRKEETMTAELSGKYSYNDLKFELRHYGIKNSDLSSALKKVASDNNIDDIKSLNGDTEITISKSIFEEAQNNIGAISPFETDQNDVLLPFSAQNIITKFQTEMPEIYNDDDYEVVDYEDFYNFQNTQNTENKSQEHKNNETENKNDKNDKNEKNEKKIDYEEFQADYSKQFGINNFSTAQKEDALKKVFSGLDTNSDNFLSQSELSGAYYSSMFNQNKDDENKNLVPDEKDVLMGQDMMSMDMQSDSFNPQG